MPRIYTTRSSWSGDRRSFPDRTRRRILRRDQICVLCRIRPATIADHIVNHPDAKRRGWTERQYHHEDNGQGVCDPCHREKTKVEQDAGRARRSRRRPPQRHPGLL